MNEASQNNVVERVFVLQNLRNWGLDPHYPFLRGRTFPAASGSQLLLLQLRIHSIPMIFTRQFCHDSDHHNG